jgi:uncharacterized protein (DUF1778 family)
MSRAARVTNKSGRMEARLKPDQKRLIERAAELQGVSLTNFILAHLLPVATATIQESETLRLREEDRKVFISALVDPPKANKFAKSAVARYKKQVGF